MPARNLPIYEIETPIVECLRSGGRLILSAPTGSGKSTQVPQILDAHGFLDAGQAVVLQPRRLPTRMLAARVAHEMGVEPGAEVGYQIRFENVTSPKTRIRFVTEGVLLRQMVENPALPGISVLVFDEFHERHLYGDITLARALDIQESIRPDLKIIVMSATLERQIVENYLSPCAVLESQGRMFPVEIQYRAPSAQSAETPVWELAADAFSHYVAGGGPGDVLVFMPGSFEIQQTIQEIRHRAESRGFIILPLHGELPPRDQDAAVERYEQRKVVVATNVAETSLTIDGIRLVIDSGQARIPRYDPYRGINTLLVEKISRASADQRAGRAGRTAEGVCMRLWTEREHGFRDPQEAPEVRRLDLSEVVLTLKSAGVVDLRKFRWLEKPDEAALAHAEELLSDLGALDRAGAITDTGRKMLAFPLHPRYARMLLAARDQQCVYQACLVAALTQGRDLLLRSHDRGVREKREELFGDEATSDFWIWMRAWNYASKNQYRVDVCRRLGIHAVTARQVGPLFDQFLKIAEKEGLDVRAGSFSETALQKCILIGFSDRLARRLDAGTLRCELVHGRRGVLARESVVQKSPLLVAAEVREVQTRDELSTILSLATAVDVEWIREFFGSEFEEQVAVSFDSSARRVIAGQQIRFRGLVLESRRVEPPPQDAAARLLADEVIAGRLVLKDWDASVEQWIVRLNCLAKWRPELELPPITDEDKRHLIEQIALGAFSYKDLKDREVKTVVRSWLSSSQRQSLDDFAPERLKLSNGRTPKVTYVPDASPFIALRIQELFGVEETPRIAQRQVPVLIHILAPSMRPVQITQDLAGFWREHYPRIKQELQRKYPKHEWR